MIRRNSYVLGAVAGSFALAYGLKNTIYDVSVRENECLGESKNGPHVLATQNPKQLHKNVTLPLDLAIQQATNRVQKYKNEIGAPGIIIGVSIDGNTVWSQGFGVSDVENGILCSSETVMRIASISKSMTMAVVAKLWESGKLDMDKPVQEYVPTFPPKMYNGEKVSLTTRMLVSHLSGIRHYKKKTEHNYVENNNNDNNQSLQINDNHQSSKSNKSNKNNKKPSSQSDDQVQPIKDSQLKEFYLKDNFENVEKALSLFKDDELMSKPGTTYLYTTHGWTLISAVVEGATKGSFTSTMKAFFKVMGLRNTYLDENEPLIFNRSRYYAKNKRGRLINAPYIDNSCKWAGGGFLSTVGDLLKFGNAMLYSYQGTDSASPPGYLRADTMRALWTPTPGTSLRWGREDGYGMGWMVVPYRHEYGFGDEQEFMVGHTGGAVGASSVLLLKPPEVQQTTPPPSGVAVAILVNLQEVSLHPLAIEVANIFSQVAM